MVSSLKGSLGSTGKNYLGFKRATNSCIRSYKDDMTSWPWRYKGRKRIVVDDEDDEDKISNLPKNVIDYILGKMPIRDAIRTSVLSKKWRFNYLTIPQLVFDEQFYIQLKDFVLKDFVAGKVIRRNVITKYYYDEIITKLLLLHPGQIETFSVWIPEVTLMGQVPNVNKWILYLSRKNVKELILYFRRSSKGNKLPPYFFDCVDLTYLELLNVDISCPLEFKGFLYLQLLFLCGVHFENNCFESILDKCPVLQELAVQGCSGVSHFKISGSELEDLFIQANDQFESISLDSAPNLTKVCVERESIVTRQEDEKYRCDLAGFMDSLPKVKKLGLNGNFVQLLAQIQVPTVLSTIPFYLTSVELKDLNFTDFDQITTVVCLIRSAPNLEELHIVASTVEVNEEQVSGYLELMDYTSFPLGKLMFVIFKNISGYIPEIEFIRFLLSTSPSLEKMKIIEHPDIGRQRELDIARKLLQIQSFRQTPVHIDFTDQDSKE